MVRARLRYVMFIAVPLLMVFFVVGCHSPGRHVRAEPCSGCNQSLHRSTASYGNQAVGGQSHAQH